MNDLVTLVVPLYNEAESLPQLLAEIRAVAADLGRPVEVLFVDDGSRDSSWAVVADLAVKEPRIRGLRLRRNFGKSAALAAGFRAARGSTVFTLDADLQDDPAEIPRFLAELDKGFDVVSGWKRVRHDPWHKVFPSRVFNALVSRVSGVKLHDHNCGFKAYRGTVTAELAVYGERHRFLPVLAAARGYRVGELVVHHRARQFGRSKFGWQRFIKGFLDLVSVRFVTAYGSRPLHLLGSVAIVLGLACLAALAGVALAWWAVASAGLTLLLTIAAILTGTAAVQCVLAGLVAELLVSRAPVVLPDVSATIPEGGDAPA